MKATGSVEVPKGQPVSIGWRAPSDTEHFSLVRISPAGKITAFPIKTGQSSMKLAASEATGTLKLKSGLKTLDSVEIIVSE